MSSAFGAVPTELDLLHLQGAFDSAGIDDFSDPRLDLFLVDHHTPPQRLRHLLAAAWNIDPDTTLKLMCYLLRRAGNAASAAEEGGSAFYTAAAWMHRNHPRTLAGNIAAFAGLGLIRDFPELLHRLVQDAEDTKVVAATIGRKRARSHDGDEECSQEAEEVRAASPSQEERRRNLAAVALNMLRNDDAYRSLHDSVAAFFARSLSDDRMQLDKGGIPSNLGLAVSFDSPFDQTTLLCDAIACLLFRSDSDEHQRRQHLHDQVLVPLQSALPKQSSPDPNKKKKKSTTTAPLPHQIAHHLGREQKRAIRKQKAIVQWDAVVQVMRNKRSLVNCLAVCDMSMSVAGDSTPVKVAVAMALLTSQLAVDPWSDWVHAFNKDCTPHSLASITSYEDKVEYIRKMKCECDAQFNLRKVFDWILFMVKCSKGDESSPEQKHIEPVNTIFVFTSKDFDEALVPPCRNKRPEDFDPAAVRPWNEEYDNICDKFKKAGVEVPDVVFWNLKGQRSPGLTSTSDGVMRLSGYSDDLMMLFLGKNGVVEPEDELYHAIAGEEYQKLQVFD
ncbi:unnamed protein product [Urochloa humidicola]